MRPSSGALKPSGVRQRVLNHVMYQAPTITHSPCRWTSYVPRNTVKHPTVNWRRIPHDSWATKLNCLTTAKDIRREIRPAWSKPVDMLLQGQSSRSTLRPQSQGSADWEIRIARPKQHRRDATPRGGSCYRHTTMGIMQYSPPKCHRNQQNRQCTHNVIHRRVRETIVAIEKIFLCVCVGACVHVWVPGSVHVCARV